jgi:hypothetical protein
MKTAAIGALIILAASQANAEDWVVRKNQSSRNCFVVLSTALPNPFPVLLATAKTRKEACQKAKDLKTEDITQDKMCQTYGPTTISDCKAEGVELK